MAKALTRINIEVDGIGRELFKVKENTRKSLTIMLKHAAAFTDHIRPGLDIKSQKYSVHNCDNSEGNLLHHTLILANKKKLESHSFHFAVPNRLFFSTFWRVAPDLRNQRYVSNPKPRDVVHTIDTYDPGKSTLFYGLAIGASDSPWEIEDDRMFNFFVCNFSLYKLVVGWCYYPIASSDAGDMLHRPTSSLTIDGVRTDDIPQIPEHGEPPQEVTNYFAGSLITLQARLGSRLVAANDRSGLEALRATPFVKRPLE